ncbi:hypothetical protein ACUN8C_01575 [Kushneria sp. Sum13]|uniref:hypothetical protein n=1 Tax=Kushneria sp. Sum13 TaxID=3459196 RepID=UPI0040464C2E
MNKTIQDLKDENQLLRDGIRTITSGLMNGEYADLLSTDHDLTRLHTVIGCMVEEVNQKARKVELLKKYGIACDAQIGESQRRIALLAAPLEQAWDNGYLNGREDTLSELAQKDRDIEKDDSDWVPAGHSAPQEKNTATHRGISGELYREPGSGSAVGWLVWREGQTMAGWVGVSDGRPKEFVERLQPKASHRGEA